MGREIEIAVVGAGPAGLYAGLEAAKMGASVVILDAYPKPGGQYYRQPPPYFQKHLTSHQMEGRALWQKVLESGADIITNATVWYGDKDKTLIYHHSEKNVVVKPKAVILACGTYERPVAFPGWTLPGVLMTGGAQTLLVHGVLPGKRVLLSGSGPLQLVVAKKLVDAGAEVVAVLEGSSRIIRRGFKHISGIWGQWERLAEGISSLTTLIRKGIAYRLGWGIVSAQGTDQVEKAIIARYDEDWRPISGSEQEIVCDTICIGYGFLPFTALGKLMGIKHYWDERWYVEIPQRDETMQTNLPGVFVAGDGAALGGARCAILEGRIAGISAASYLGYKKPQTPQLLQRLRAGLNRERAFIKMYTDLFSPADGLFELAKEDTIICRCEGIPLGEVRRAFEQGAKTVGEIKYFTRTGMGECQGRMCGNQINTLLSHWLNQSPAEAGLYTVRPPLFPLPVQSLLLDEEVG
ncbi:MAG: cyanide-forming glycine dehydrogenase subunit HcnB [Anaerolineales bacterium]